MARWAAKELPMSAVEKRQVMTPYLTCKRAAEAIAFYGRAFGAVEISRIDGDDGRIGHADLKIGDGVFFLSDEYPEIDVRGPETLGGSTCAISLAVDDADAANARAVAAGARELRPVQDLNAGKERIAKVADPYGHVWFLHSIKDLRM
jgi:PhnB protein